MGRDAFGLCTTERIRLVYDSTYNTIVTYNGITSVSGHWTRDILLIYETGVNAKLICKIIQPTLHKYDTTTSHIYNSTLGVTFFKQNLLPSTPPRLTSYLLASQRSSLEGLGSRLHLSLVGGLASGGLLGRLVPLGAR